MSFDPSELELVRSSLRHTIDSSEPAVVLASLIAEGWNELVETDPAAAVTALCEQAGAARSAAPALDLAMLWGAGICADSETAVIVDGLATASAEQANRFVCISEDGVSTVDGAAVELQPAGGLDPALQMKEATISDPNPSIIGDAGGAARAIAAGRRGLASQLVGASEQMLDDTLAYVSERHQYGRAIGSFQTVKHRLADVKVAITAARAGTRTSWEHADTPDGEILAMAAKCLAGRAQELASVHCFQVHGGIAFTAEHGFQNWVRRGFLLDLLLGGHEALAREIGQRIIQQRSLPRAPQLY